MDEWSEVNVPVPSQTKSMFPPIYNFTTPGEELIGKLLIVESIQTRYGLRNVARFELKDMTQVTVFMTVDLEYKLRNVKVGDWVKIVYLGIQNNQKKYAVYVKRDRNGV